MIWGLPGLALNQDSLEVPVGGQGEDDPWVDGPYSLGEPVPYQTH